MKRKDARATGPVRSIYSQPAAGVPAARRATIWSWSWQIATAFLVVAVPAQAFAYTIQSAATKGCHERLTRNAWRGARANLPEGFAQLASRGDDEALMADVPFDVPPSMKDIGSVTLLLGVRDNDLKEHGPNSLTELNVTASDPEHQADHCLRAPDEDEPGGSRAAVAACHDFIRAQLVAALDGLDENGRPDGARRDKLRVSLAIRDEIDVSVPRFFLRAGRGLHAIQDSFTHTFRNPDDPTKIRVVLNFTEYSQGTLEESVDGPAHASELDQCDDADALRTERRLLATEASSVALLTLLDPSLQLDAKKRAIDELLERYLGYDEAADCREDNAWCDAPENKYGSPPLGCQIGGAVPSGGSSLAFLFMAATVIGFRRRRQLATIAASLGSVFVAATARAEDKQGPIDSPAAALAGESDAATPGKVDKAGAFFARIAIGASYDNAAFSAGAGLRYQLSRKWMLGVDGEWNPYAAISPGKLRMGSGNAYVSLIRRFQLARANINIRTTASLGASTLLFDLVGADKYSFGPYFGLSFLGVEWKMARGFYLTVDPTYIAIPVPKIVGVPFSYAQYRFLVGLEFGG
jgi:hypothetical protein